MQFSKEHNRTTTISIKPPITYFELRSFFLKKKNSLFNNLSHPQVLVLSDHAYCRSIECVADFIAHGAKKHHKIRKEYVVESLLKSQYGKNQVQIASEANGIAVAASLWMDDFEPNYSKNNRGSVWIALIALETMFSERVTTRNIYPIAVGPKGTDH